MNKKPTLVDYAAQVLKNLLNQNDNVTVRVSIHKEDSLSEVSVQVTTLTGTSWFDGPKKLGVALSRDEYEIDSNYIKLARLDAETALRELRRAGGAA